MGKVELPEGETHSFLVSKTRQHIRSVRPKKPEKPLVDTPVWDRAPSPEKVTAGAFNWTKPVRQSNLERKIQVARDEFEANPAWRREAERMRTEAARENNQNARWRSASPQRPRSRAYSATFKREKLNFDTGMAKTSIQQLQDTKVIYYSPLAGKNRTSPHTFNQTLRGYSYIDNTLFTKQREKNLDRRYRKEMEASEAAHEQSVRRQQAREAYHISLASRPSVRGLAIPLGAGDRLDEDGAEHEVPDAPLDSPILQAAMPHELQRIKTRTQRAEEEQMELQQEHPVSVGLPADLDSLQLASRRHREATPQLQRRAQQGKRSSQNEINVGLMNAEIRDVYYQEGSEHVGKFIKERFQSGPGQSRLGTPKKPPSPQQPRNPPPSRRVARINPGEIKYSKPSSPGLGLQGTSPLPPHESPEPPSTAGLSGLASSGGADGHLLTPEPGSGPQQAADEAGETLPSTASSLGRERAAPSNLMEARTGTASYVGTASTAQSTEQGNPGELQNPRTSLADASIFNKLIHKSIRAEEIPENSPTWLAYTVYHQDPEDEEDSITRFLRGTTASTDAGRRSVGTAGSSNVSGSQGGRRRKPGVAKAAEAAGSHDAETELPAAGRRKVSPWKRGAITLRQLQVPTELEISPEKPPWLTKAESKRFSPQGRSGCGDPYMSPRPRVVPESSDGDSDGSSDEGTLSLQEIGRGATRKHLQYARDLWKSDLLLKSAESALTPLQRR